MKRWIILITIIGLFVLLLPLTAGAETSGTCGPDMTWVLDDDGVLTISGTGEITSYPWDKRAVVEAIIPDGVTEISSDLFSRCSNMTNIHIPNSVTSIGKSAFWGCDMLSNIVIPDSVTNIGGYAFYGCERLCNITIPTGVTNIGECAFFGCCSLSSITIPNGVTDIGACAFYGCWSLPSITIPNSVSSIGNAVFYNCPAIRYSTLDSDGAKALSKAGYSFRVADNQYDLKYLYINDEINGLEILKSDKDITTVVVLDGVTSIGNSAFSGCSNLSSITIPGTVTSIGNSAFSGCSSLSSINIPDSITSIGDAAFFGCSSLLNFNIPDNITSIGYYTFEGCSSLLSINIPDSVTNIGYAAFSSCSSLLNINMPSSITSIEESAFGGCSSLTSIIIPDSVTSLGDYVFYGCTSLSSITLPEGIIEICENTLPNNIRNICILGKETSIRKNALPYDATLYCYSSSIAYEWGLDYEMDIILLDDIEIDSLLSVSIPESMQITVLSRTAIPATIFPYTAEQIITWESSDETILIVDDNGMLIPFKAGSVTVTLSAGSKHVQSEITIFPVAESISLDADKLYVVLQGSALWIPLDISPAGAYCQLETTVSDSELLGSQFNYLDNGWILIVWGDKSIGETSLSITDTLSGRAITIPVRVVKGVSNVIVEPEEITVEQGETKQLHIESVLSNGVHTSQRAGLSFNMQDEAIAKVDYYSGIISGLALGDTNLIICYDSGSGRQQIAVPIHVTALEYSYLPASLLDIEEESFYGSDFVRVIIPDGCRTIGSKAFANCNSLRYIFIPASVTSIAEDAFENCGDELVIERAGE